MKGLFTTSLAILILLGISSTVSAQYTATSITVSTNPGVSYSQNFNVSGYPASGPGTLTIYLKGDYNSGAAGNEMLNVSDENFTLLSQAVTGAQCSASFETTVIPLTQAQINAWGANNLIAFTFLSGTGTGLCAGEFYTTLSFPTAYCVSSASNPGDSDIENVTFNTINQSSTGYCTGYTNYTGVSTTLTVGASYNLSVTTADCDGGSTFNRQTRAYIDWNADGDFTDSDELVLNQALGAATTTIQNVTVPSGALIGQTILRVVTSEAGTISPCGVFAYGETEDYTIDIISVCVSGATNPIDTDIENVTFNTINQNSVGICSGYTDYTAVSTTLNTNSTYNLSVTTADCDGGSTFNRQTRAYIDWNNDGDFTDSGELVLTEALGAATTTNQSVTVPSGAFIGQITMRVVTTEAGTISPCGSFTYGETEDYTLFINNTVVFCGSTINTFPYYEDFESFALCSTTSGATCTLANGWINESGDDIDWTTDQGGTTSSSTGPTADFNPGTSTGNYLYLEASSNGAGFPNMEAILSSPCFNFSGLSNSQIQFAYNMYGSTMGSLTLEISIGGVWASIWSLSGNQGTGWNTATVSLAAYNGQTIKLRFRGVTGSNYFSDMAIDDITVTAQPFCIATIASLPYNEDFESFALCSTTSGASCTLANGWSNDNGDDIDWTTDQGGTTSNNTGPTADYNPGSSTGNYLYLEASTNGVGFPNMEAIISSPCFNLPAMSNSQIQFAYNMYGATMGSLSLEISTGGTWTNLWSLSGNQGTGWNTATVSLAAYNGQTIKLRFRGVTGSNFESDMAIDDINVTATVVPFCATTIASFPYNEDFESFSLCSTTPGASCTLANGWTNINGDNLDWITDQGGTNSSNTGPTADYNPGTSTGNYLYVEASSSGVGYPYKQAIITSPCFDLSSSSNFQIQFAYNMYGSTMGSLTLEVSTGGAWTSLWALSGDQGTNWNTATVSLAAYTGQTIKLRFRGFTGTNYFSDMAIDDINITSGCTPNIVDLYYSNCDIVTVLGVTYTSSQIVSDTVLVNNCDSITNFNITVNYSSSSTATITGCGSVIYSGTTYNSSQTITNTLSGAAASGCDSTITTNIVVYPNLSGVHNETVCYGGSIVINGTIYNASNLSGTETYTNIGPNNCDSVVTVNLTVLTPLTGINNGSLCFGSSTIINGTTYNASNLTGTEIFTNVGPNNCDSIVTVSISILAPLVGVQNETICFGENIIINGTTYDASNLTGTEVFTNIGPNNCDSIVTISLTVLAPLVGMQNETICYDGSVVINGTTYDLNNQSGTEIFTNIGPNNCDSSVTVTLTVLPQIDNTTSLSIVTITANQAGATYQWIDCNNGNSPISGETNSTFTAVTNGDYAVIVTLGSCSVTSSCVNINKVGVDEYLFGSEIKLYPNPTKNNVTIDLGEIKNAAISIVSITGKEIYHLNKASSNKIQLSLDRYSKGIYFVKIQSDNLQKVIKLIKQ